MDTLIVHNPFNGEKLEEIPFQPWRDIDKALDRAYDMFKNNRRRLTRADRMEILEKFEKLVQQHFDALVKLAVSEGGKPQKDTIIEVNRAINGIRLASESLANMHGEMIPMGRNQVSSGRIAYTTLEATGVVLAISAFNHPVNLIIHQVITAVAIGAPVIIKPALKTPLSCRYLVNLLYEAGLPVDYCQMIICRNPLTEKMAMDKRIAYVSFIGSHRVGWHLRSVLAPGTRIALEHGGVAPAIIESDADLDDLIDPLVKAAFYHAGQVCVSTQRIYVHKDKMKAFQSKFIKAVKALKTGDPAKAKTDVGPMIVREELERIERWVKDAESEGAKILTGGKRILDTCFKPTVLLEPAPYSYVATEELFGPVVSIFSFSFRDEVVKRANALRYSFQAAIYTKNLDKAMYYSNNLRANTVLINDHTAFRVDWMPFGGSELSGLGTGGIYYTMKDMCKEKLVVIKSQEL